MRHLLRGSLMGLLLLAGLVAPRGAAHASPAGPPPLPATITVPGPHGGTFPLHLRTAAGGHGAGGPAFRAYGINCNNYGPYTEWANPPYDDVGGGVSGEGGVCNMATNGTADYTSVGIDYWSYGCGCWGNAGSATWDDTWYRNSDHWVNVRWGYGTRGFTWTCINGGCYVDSATVYLYAN